MTTKKKAVKKKVAKKKVVKKPKTFSLVACELITAGKLSKENIAKKLLKEYPGVKLNGIRAVNYYINFITLGKMKRIGFDVDSVPDMHRKTPKLGQVHHTAHKLTEEKTPVKRAVKKVAKKKSVIESVFGKEPAIRKKAVRKAVRRK